MDMDRSGGGESARGMVNVPITDDLAVRAVGFYENTPGYIDNVLTGDRNTNALTSDGGRLSVFYQPTSKITVRVSALMQQLNTDNTDSEDVVIAANGSFSPKYGNYEEQRFSNEPEGVRYYLYNATVNWDMDWATLTSSSSFGILHDHSLADATAFYGTDLLGYLDQGKFTQEVRLASEPGSGPIEWLAGIYYTNEVSSLHQVLVGIGPLFLDSEYNEIAGFADLTYHVTSKLALSFGGRYSTNDQSSNEFGLESGGGVSPASDSFTWSAAAHYELDDQTSLYARVATGFRPGGPNVEPVGAPSTIPKTYNPDSLIDYELGAKSDLPDENLSFDADVFLINWTDIQLLTEVDNTGVNANGGTARSEGAEADVTWMPIDRLTFSLNGAFTDAYLTQNTNLLFVDGLKGNPLPWSPRWSGTLDGDYEFQSIGDWTPYVGAALHYIGSRDSTFNGLLVQGAYGFSQSQYKMPSYNTLDLRVGVNWSRWSIELYAKNLNDAKGITAFSPYGTSAASFSPPGPVGAANVSLIEPRIVGIVLRGSF
jgi:outer membrane receptor protein involved in Fe transport